MTQFRTTRPASIRRQIDSVLTSLDTLDLSPQTRRRLAQIYERFARYAHEGLRAPHLGAVTDRELAEFVAAPSSSNSRDPSVATAHLRRTALRILFREARRLGFVSVDPSLDLTLPDRKRSGGVRPLTDEEVARCRAAATADRRLAAAWSLAEATATTAELPCVSLHDIDPTRARVWLAGGTKTDPRWGYFSDWGLTQIERRVDALKRTGTSKLVYGGRGSPESQQASSCIAISTVLRRVGIRSPEVRPSSVRAWAACRIFQETQAVDVVASRLGLRTLDAAARLIGWDWRASGES